MPTPRELGYAMPPAWVRPRRHWLAWPPDDWIGDIDAAREALAELVGLMAEDRPVSVLANPAEAANVSLMCGPGIGAIAIPHAASALRALGPVFLVHPAHGVGGLVCPDEPDVAGAIVEHQQLARFETPLRRLGVMVDVDGEGTALAAEALAAVHGREAAEGLLRDALGVERVIWLDGGIDGDLTGGAVLNAARFLAPGLVIVAVEPDRTVPDTERLSENLRRLEGAHDARGRRIATVQVPLPRRRERADGSRMAMSYADCFVDDGLVVLPAFEDGRDEVAYDRVVQALLEHTVVSFPALEFAQGGCGLGGLVLSQPREPAPPGAVPQA